MIDTVHSQRTRNAYTRANVRTQITHTHRSEQAHSHTHVVARWGDVRRGAGRCEMGWCDKRCGQVMTRRCDQAMTNTSFCTGNTKSEAPVHRKTQQNELQTHSPPPHECTCTQLHTRTNTLVESSCTCTAVWLLRHLCHIDTYAEVNDKYSSWLSNRGCGTCTDASKPGSSN